MLRSLYFRVVSNYLLLKFTAENADIVVPSGKEYAKSAENIVVFRATIYNQPLFICHHPFYVYRLFFLYLRKKNVEVYHRKESE